MNIIINDVTTNTEQIRRIEKKNENVHLKLKIVKMSWSKSVIKRGKFRTTLRLKIEKNGSN